MTSESLFRTAGIGLLVGGSVAGVGDLSYNLLSGEPVTTAATAAALTAFVGSIVVVICLPAIAVRQASRAGVLGLVGYGLLTLAFLVFGVASEMLNAFVDPLLPPDLAAQPPVGLIATWMLTELGAIVGLALLGVATLRARVFPSWIGWTFILAGTLLLASHAPLPFANLASLGHVVLVHVAVAAAGLSLVRANTLGVTTAARSSTAAVQPAS